MTKLFHRTPHQIRHGVERRVQTAWYGLGDDVRCPYCGWSGTRFLPAGQSRAPNRLCPRCGSLERYRMLYLYLTQHTPLLERRTRLLDIAPKPCLTNFCRSLRNVSYVSSDLETSGAMVFSDLTRMGMASASFDIIVCMHVIEHILDDHAAFVEIGRLLKPGGAGLVMVPIDRDVTFEDPDARPDEYERLYGQHDHVRRCGMDTADRMRTAGLNVDVLDIFELLGPETCRTYALRGDDRYLFRVSGGDTAFSG
jgi:SAM-dependent methyltransferase